MSAVDELEAKVEKLQKVADAGTTLYTAVADYLLLDDRVDLHKALQDYDAAMGRG